MAPDNEDRARDWYAKHRAHVNKMLSVNGACVEPGGSDAGNPAVWKDIHWRWFMVREVEKQILK